MRKTTPTPRLKSPTSDASGRQPPSDTCKWASQAMEDIDYIVHFCAVSFSVSIPYCKTGIETAFINIPGRRGAVSFPDLFCPLPKPETWSLVLLIAIAYSIKAPFHTHPSLPIVITLRSM